MKSITMDSLLVKHKEYGIEEDFIYAITEDTDFYNPFKQVEKEVIKEILQEDYVNADFDLHTLFLNLKFGNKEQVLRFTNQFGFLFNPIYMGEELQKTIIGKFDLKQLRYRIGLFSSLHYHEEYLLVAGQTDRSLSVTEFYEEVERGRHIIELYMAIIYQDTSYLSQNTKIDLFMHSGISHSSLNPVEELREHPKLGVLFDSILNEVNRSKQNSYKISRKEFESLTNDINSFYDALQIHELEHLLIEMCIVYFETSMEIGLKGVSPKISVDSDGKTVQTWVFSSLLSSIYFMINQNFIAGRNYKRCNNPRCHHLFIAKAKNNNYCSAQCQTRAKTARSKEKQKSKVINLSKKGLTLEEIAAELNTIEKERIRGWINKSL
jgi:hypothetical protein